MIIKYFFWEIIFKLRRAPIFQKLICIWHSYNTTVIKWWSHNFKIYYLIISKLSKNIYNNNPKRLPKFEGCSLTHLKVMPTVPGHMPHPVYVKVCIENIIQQSLLGHGLIGHGPRWDTVLKKVQKFLGYTVLHGFSKVKK